MSAHRTLLALLLALLVAGGAFAQATPPPLPISANWCADGEPWQGACLTPQDWVCGWYMARFATDRISTADMPDECRGYARQVVSPVGSPGENWCFPGAPWSGECVNDWYWTCGYYIAQYTADRISEQMVAPQCRDTLPPAVPFLCGADEFGDVCVEGLALVFYTGRRADNLVDFVLTIYRAPGRCAPDETPAFLADLRLFFSNNTIFSGIGAENGYVCYPSLNTALSSASGLMSAPPAAPNLSRLAR